MATIADICGMYLLLTAATSAEIQPGIDFLEKRDFTLQSLHAEIMVTGIGAVSTTYSLTSSINNRKPDIIIQAGIAGSFGQKKTGEVVTVEQDTFGDMGAWENDQFKNIFDLRLVDDNQPPFNDRFLINPYQKLLFLSGLEQVRAITVNEISTDSKKIEWYKQNLSPAVESMEGAALHYVCLQENIPFLQIRSVSNEIGERDKIKWKLAEAINNLNEKLILLFNELSQYNETYFRI
jgi:futalosine hydrolase